MDPGLIIPIPISLVNGRYFLFSIQTVSYLRREHHICGALIGTIPQSPSQNVFLGLPVELMSEEAQLLVSKGVAYVVDDVKAHRQTTRDVNPEDRARYLATLQKDGAQASRAQQQRKSQNRQKSLKSSSSPSSDQSTVISSAEETTSGNDSTPTNEVTEDALFHTATSARPQIPLKPLDMVEYSVTPATSETLFPSSPPTTPSSSSTTLPDMPSSYPLFKHLHDQGYYMCPGLRFGCQYTVYPGDPLRFHSHFLAVGTEWDEEINLMDIVGGGRLGTGVKKGFLFGGADRKGDVKTFSVEWAGM